MRGLKRTEKFEMDKPSNLNLKRKPRGWPSWKQEARSCVVPVTRSSEPEKGNRRKLSTGIGRTAWKQAGQKRKGSGTKETGKHRGNRRQGRTGSRERKERKAE